MDTFSTVEIMFEFSKSIRHGIISLESLNDLEGVDLRESAPCLNLSVLLTQKRRHTSYR